METILKHKNPTITTRLKILKIRYRDEKRMKAKVMLFYPNGNLMEKINITVKPDFLKDFVLQHVEINETREDLSYLDDYKDWSL